MIRTATKRDRKAIIALIDAIFEEYGDQVLLSGAEADLNHLESAFAGQGGGFWVYEMDGKIIGTVAVVPEADGQAVLKRVYLDKTWRGHGIADTMLEWIIEWCRARDMTTLYFWSDARFARAHHFYEKRGFVRGAIRHKDDGNMPYSEYHFEKKL